MRPADGSDIQEPVEVDDWIADDFTIAANALNEIQNE